MPEQSSPSDPLEGFIGEKLRSMRLLKGMSQSELGRAIGMSFQQIQKYERGVNRMAASTLLRAAGALGRSVSEFFPPDGDDPALGNPDDKAEEQLLADLFSSMGTAQRRVLLQVAQEFCRRD